MSPSKELLRLRQRIPNLKEKIQIRERKLAYLSKLLDKDRLTLESLE